MEDDSNTVTVDRQRALLTPDDRRFLFGTSDGELSDNARAQKRYNIRQRVIHGIMDFNALVDLSDRDIELIFDKYTETTHEGLLFNSGTLMALAFIYEGLGRSQFEGAVTDTIRSDIQRIHAEARDEFIEVDVSIEVEYGETLPREEVVSRLERDEELPRRASGVAHTQGWEDR